MREWLLKEGSFMKAYYDKGGTWSDAQDGLVQLCKHFHTENLSYSPTHKDVNAGARHSNSGWERET